MPKSPKGAKDPSTRRAVASIMEPERGLVLRVLLYSPKDTLAAAVALAGAASILTNALLLQAGRHPSPMFGTTVTMPKVVQSPPAAPRGAEPVAAPAPPPTVTPVPPTVSPLPRPRPVEAAPRTATGDPLGHLVRSTSVVTTAPANIQRAPPPPPPPSPVQEAPATTQSTPAVDPLAGLIVSSQRVAAIQQALTDYGYGPIRITGTVGIDTQAAVQKFERERRMPITGVLSEKLIRELSIATGRSFD